GAERRRRSDRHLFGYGARELAESGHVRGTNTGKRHGVKGSTLHALFVTAHYGALVGDVVQNTQRGVADRFFDDFGALDGGEESQALATLLGQFGGDVDVGPGRPGRDDLRRHGRDATFDVGDRAVALVLYRGRQDHAR